MEKVRFQPIRHGKGCKHKGRNQKTGSAAVGFTENALQRISTQQSSGHLT